MPKISVIIPIYNSEKYLKECLESVINQTFKNIEIICIDDGSTDLSGDILEEYARKDNRIILIKQKNQYAGVARNKGIEIARGDYIHFLDSDDWIKNNTYEHLYNLMLENNDIDFIFFQHDRVDTLTGKISSKRRVLRGKKRISNIHENPDFFINNEVAPWNKLYKRKFIIDNKLKFDDTIVSNDKSFYINAILVANKILVSKESFVYYRVNNSNSLMGETRAKNYECLFKSYESILKICENSDINIKRMIIENAIGGFLFFYHKTNNKYREQIYTKLQNYFQTIDVSFWDNELKKPKWWDEYIAIKNNTIYRDKNIMKYYIKTTIKYIKDYGIYCAICQIFSKIISKIKNIMRKNSNKKGC